LERELRSRDAADRRVGAQVASVVARERQVATNGDVRVELVCEAAAQVVAGGEADLPWA
jgi:hypothetical protein